jgi:GMP synthase-like glutamine amidotransferase
VKPVAILQHQQDASAGVFEHFLRDRRIPWVTIRVDEGEALPVSAEPFSGICSLGGSMSVNDDLPWIEHELRLMRDADARGRALIGHCLGGQLMARAFGGRVLTSAYKEIGWGEVVVDDITAAQEWLGGPLTSFEVYHWHGDTFEPPPGARHLMSSALCKHQAYLIERPHYAHLGMQFHIEMTPGLVRAWSTEPSAEREIELERRLTGGPGVQTPAQMLDDLEARTARMNIIAEKLYARWAQGLAAG